MNATVKTLEREASKLTVDGRFELVEQILAGIDVTDPDIDAAWAAEAQDRLEAWRKGGLKSRPAAEVFAKYAKP
jgi:hypothetical protein